MNRAAAWVAFLLVVGSCASSQKSVEVPTARASLSVPKDLHADVELATAVGRQLYVLDKVAAIGTDVVLTKVPDLGSRGLGGYIQLREADEDGHPKDSFLVFFFTAETPPRIAYRIRIKPEAEPEFEAFDPPASAPGSFTAFARARQVAINSLPPTDQPINPIVMPGATRGEKGVLVYLLAGTKRPNVAVFGRHFRALIPDGGTTPTYLLPLSNSILEIPTKGPNGETPVALTVTHLVTDFPLETHVFNSLLLHLPIYVGTRRGVWLVDGDKVALVDEKVPAGVK